MSNKKYDASSIVRLSDREHVRNNVGMYLGSGSDAVIQSIYEVVSNSIDEFLNGYGKKIDIQIEPGLKFTICDEGRGIPVDFNEVEGMSALELAVGNLRAGGKSKAQDDKSYKVSGGTFGIGVSAVNYVSKTFKATVYRDGAIWEIEYKDGIKVSDLKKIGETKKTGTEISFVLDEKILKTSEDEFKISELESLIEVSSYMNKGLEFIVNGKTFKSNGGLKDKISKESKKRTTNIFYVNKKESEIDVELAFCWGTGREKINSYANTLKTTNGGAHVQQFKTTLTRELNKLGKEKGLIKENLSGDSIRSGLNAEVAVTGPNFDLHGQTKDKLLSKEAGTAVNKILVDFLSTIAESQLKKIFSNAKAQEKADKAAEKARAIALGLKDDRKKRKENPFENASKLLDCYGTKRKNCELILTEGDGAGGGLATERNPETQAILPLRGKIRNAEKAGLKALENEEVKSFFKALGAGILNDYDSKKLRYGKVIITTDADTDGAHIRSLILTLIKNYCINLIEDGKVYVAVPPKYEAINKKGEVVFIRDDEELESLKGKVSGVHGLKGLGSMDPDTLYKTTLDPKDRTLIQIQPDNLDLFIENVEKYMGKSPKFRKELVLG